MTRTNWIRHSVTWDGERWVCTCKQDIRNDAEAQKHYNDHVDRLASQRIWLEVELEETTDGTA